MASKIPAWVKPAFWGVIAGALVWWGVLVWGLGWVSAGNAHMTAHQTALSAVAAAASPFCVARFEQQANAVAAWQKLKKSADNGDQDDFLVKGGWIAAPGAKADSDFANAIADRCATKLLALKELDGVKLTSAQ
jgi:hypothetical protein